MPLVGKKCSANAPELEEIHFSLEVWRIWWVPVIFTVSSKLYWTVAIQKMLYGLEVTQLSENITESIEGAHRQHYEIIQGLPDNIPCPASSAPLG